jgi:hypothetical protein
MLSITIDTGNAAFTGYAGTECARILTDLACVLQGFDVIDHEFSPITLRDINGNKVGQCRAAE